LSQENENDYLTFTCIYPPIEIATLTRGSGNKPGQTATAWASWDAALDAVENTAVKEFVRAELAKHQESRLPYREIIYRMGGKRRFWLICRRKHAYVWQWGRFEADDTYWQKVLSEPNHVQQVSGKKALRFHLTTASDFTAFAKAMSSDLTNVEFSESADLDDHSSGDE
jgi:hypothetical protein